MSYADLTVEKSNIYASFFRIHGLWRAVLRIVVLITAFSTTTITMHPLNSADLIVHLLQGSLLFALFIYVPTHGVTLLRHGFLFLLNSVQFFFFLFAVNEENI